MIRVHQMIWVPPLREVAAGAVTAAMLQLAAVHNLVVVEAMYDGAAASAIKIARSMEAAVVTITRSVVGLHHHRRKLPTVATSKHSTIQLRVGSPT